MLAEMLFYGLIFLKSNLQVSSFLYSYISLMSFAFGVITQSEISGSHGGEYDVQSCLLDYTAV
jgi:hypothetical protein